MNSGVRIGLMVLGGLVVAALLVGAGIAVGGLVWQGPFGLARNGTAWGFGMMNRFADDAPWTWGSRSGMMGGNAGILGGPGGMMGGSGGMMGSAGAFGADPLRLEQAETAVEGYLANLRNDDLALGEIMIFDNHAYAQIVETSTGIGAMEVLIDPVTLAVYPEYGPNMMWNAKYGHMAGWGMGMMGGQGGAGMMGGWTAGSRQDPEAEMPVSPAQAAESAQAYLDQLGTGLQADEHADRFYGYYTLHVLRDGATVGMLSVNGYTGQVFLHNWHGEFIEMSEAHAE